MKRILAAVAFAVLALPAFAADRGAPYENTQFDRGFLAEQAKEASNPSGGSTSAVTGAYSTATGAWANDQNFIAPAR